MLAMHEYSMLMPPINNFLQTSLQSDCDSRGEVTYSFYYKIYNFLSLFANLAVETPHFILGWKRVGKELGVNIMAAVNPEWVESERFFDSHWIMAFLSF